MQITFFGSVYNTVKNMQLEMKWQQRKLNPLMPKGNDPNSEIENLKKQAESVRKGNTISAIDAKLKSGQRISSEELEYLRVNSPQLYEKAIEIMKEREQYRRELENCKSKEEVSKLNEAKMQTFVAQASAVRSNSGLSAGDKQDCLDQIMRRMMGINNEHIEFLKTPKYSNLPEKLHNSKKKKIPDTMPNATLSAVCFSAPKSVRRIYSLNCVREEDKYKAKKSPKLSVKA